MSHKPKFAKETKKFFDLLQKKESLHSELTPYLTKGPAGRLMIAHPLLFELVYDPATSAIVNQRFQHKKHAADDFFKRRNWSSFIALHERPFQLKAFLQIEKNLSDKEYWQLLREIWIDSENIWQNQNYWEQVLGSDRKERESFMTIEEQIHLNSFPEVITGYRGFIPDKNEFGLSFSLSKERAEWFAFRFGDKGAIKKVNFKKNDVFAYVRRQGEEEIIIRPPISRNRLT